MPSTMLSTAPHPTAPTRRRRRSGRRAALGAAALALGLALTTTACVSAKQGLSEMQAKADRDATKKQASASPFGKAGDVSSDAGSSGGSGGSGGALAAGRNGTPTAPSAATNYTFPVPTESDDSGELTSAVVLDDGQILGVGQYGNLGTLGKPSAGSEAISWRGKIGADWTPVTIAPLARANTVIKAAGGVIAGGSALRNASTAPTIWRSTDGTAWTAANLPLDTTGTVIDIAAGDGGTVIAVGTSAPTGSAAQGVAWRSTDATTWSRLTIPAPAGSAKSTWGIDGITTAGPTRWLAYGWTSDGDAITGDADRRPALWTSTDSGTTWTLVPAGSGFTTDPIASIRITAASTGEYVAATIGNAQKSGTSYTQPTATYRSADGTTWQKATPGLQPTSGGLTEMAAMRRIGSTLIIGGDLITANDPKDYSTHKEVPALWTSTDGNEWKLEPLAAGGNPVAAVNDITAQPDGSWLAVGFKGKLGSDGSRFIAPAVWAKK